MLLPPPGVDDPAWRYCSLRMAGGWDLSMLIHRQTVGDRDAFVLVDVILVDQLASE